MAATAHVDAAAQGLPTTSTGYTQFPPTDIRVAPPGLDECFVSFEVWASGSYFAGGGEVIPAGSPTFRRQPIRPPSVAPRTPGSANEATAQMIQGIVASMLSSRDMRNKVSNACAVIGGPIALRLVRDDPNVLGGVAIKRTNLVIIDLGDVDKHVKSATAVAPPGTSPEAIANAISTATFGYLIALIAHEIDHLRETGTGPFAGQHSDPGQGAPEGDLTGGAVRDESLVLNELGVRSFREFYSVVHEGKPVIQVDVGGIKVNFDPASSVQRTITPASNSEHRFVPEDLAALNQIEDRCCGCDAAACDPPSNASTRDPIVEFIRSNMNSAVSADVGDNFWIGGTVGAPVASVASVAQAPTAERMQSMGGSALLKYSNTEIVIAHREPHAPARAGVVHLFALPRPTLMSMSSAWSRETVLGQRPGGASPVTAMFRSLGRSSGDAFQMEIVNATQETIAALGAGFVLEPVEKVRRQDVERELSRLKGRRTSVPINAYCMEFAKTPPVMDMIYRLMPADRAKKFSGLGPIMLSSKMLLEQKYLHPDSDPEEYFHSIRQWAIWSEEQGWKTQDAFGNALLAHTKKNYEAAKRAWTPQVEAAIKRVIPGRWRDIESVLAERDILLMRYRR